MKSKGLGLGSILTIILVIAKLLGLFAYSWLWVFSPLWIPVVLLLILPILVGVAGVIGTLFVAGCVIFVGIFGSKKD